VETAALQELIPIQKDSAVTMVQSAGMENVQMERPVVGPKESSHVNPSGQLVVEILSAPQVQSVATIYVSKNSGFATASASAYAFADFFMATQRNL